MATWLIGVKVSSNNWRFAWDSKDTNDANVTKYKVNRIDGNGNVVELMGTVNVSNSIDSYTLAYNNNSNNLDGKSFKVMGLNNSDTVISTSPPFTIAVSTSQVLLLPSPQWMSFVKVSDTSWKITWAPVVSDGQKTVSYEVRKTDISGNNPTVLDTVTTPVYIFSTDPAGFGYNVVAKDSGGTFSNPGPLLFIPSTNSPNRLTSFL